MVTWKKYPGAPAVKGGNDTMKYVCEICGRVYDEDEGCPESGIAPGTKWEDVPGDFECPVCYVGKDQFSESDD